MAAPRYKRGKPYSLDMAAYMRQLSEQNTNTDHMEQLKHNLIRCRTQLALAADMLKKLDQMNAIIQNITSEIQ